jgi:hypothetical protein
MAVVIRYFSTSAAGAGDGTTWADRAALFSAGNWSTIITSFNFSGSDSLQCLIEGGLSYTCSQSLASGLFSNAPSVANPLVLHGCDSSGNLLSPPDADWTSDLAAWSTSALPVIATTTNIATINLANTQTRLIAFTASGRNASVVGNATATDWCSIVNSTSNTSASCIAGVSRITNSVMSCTGSSYDQVISVLGNHFVYNSKVLGVTGSSGNRYGINYVGTTQIAVISKCCVTGCGGVAIISNSANVAQHLSIDGCVIANNGSDGIRLASTASQLIPSVITNNMITGNGGYGIEANGAPAVVYQNRLRDNVSGDYNTFGNYPTDMGNYTTDSDDASEYVNIATNDYQIKSDATIATLGFGVSVECAGGAATQTALVFTA